MADTLSEPVREQLWIWYTLAAVAIAYFVGFGTGYSLRARFRPSPSERFNELDFAREDRLRRHYQRACARQSKP